MHHPPVPTKRQFHWYSHGGSIHFSGYATCKRHHWILLHATLSRKPRRMYCSHYVIKPILRVQELIFSNSTLMFMAVSRATWAGSTLPQMIHSSSFMYVLPSSLQSFICSAYDISSTYIPWPHIELTHSLSSTLWSIAYGGTGSK